MEPLLQSRVSRAHGWGWQLLAPPWEGPLARAPHRQGLPGAVFAWVLRLPGPECAGLVSSSWRVWVSLFPTPSGPAVLGALQEGSWGSAVCPEQSRRQPAPTSNQMLPQITLCMGSRVGLRVASTLGL